jgi:hypothetical protein
MVDHCHPPHVAVSIVPRTKREQALFPAAIRRYLPPMNSYDDEAAFEAAARPSLSRMAMAARPAP